MFNNRVDAGQQLASALEQLTPSRPLVLALPRGGVVVGAEVARRLSCPLDVLLVKKLRAPENPELALGAVCEEGSPFINEGVARATGADKPYMEMELSRRRYEMGEQRRRYRATKPRIAPAGMTAILVDDGLATGATMIAAVQAVALETPHRLIVAVPVAAGQAVDTIGAMKEVDEILCLLTPKSFGGVGEFYRSFTQVTDGEVVDILRRFP
jgi:putative phosphoribosyl transferase